MKREEILSLFPLECNITQDMIDSGKSIGELAIKNRLPIELHEDLFWGLSIGSLKEGVLIKTQKEEVYNGKKIKVPFYLDRSSITKPISIKVELRNNRT